MADEMETRLGRTRLKPADAGFKARLMERMKQELAVQAPGPVAFNRLAVVNGLLILLIVILLLPIFFGTTGQPESSRQVAASRESTEALAAALPERLFGPAYLKMACSSGDSRRASFLPSMWDEGTGHRVSTCPSCDGSKRCRVCGGSGKNLGGDNCSICNGTGRCYTCDGKGEI